MANLNETTTAQQLQESAQYVAEAAAFLANLEGCLEETRQHKAECPELLAEETSEELDIDAYGDWLSEEIAIEADDEVAAIEAEGELDYIPSIEEQDMEWDSAWMMGR